MITLRANKIFIFLLGVVLGAALMYAVLPSPRSVSIGPRPLIWPEIPYWFPSPAIFGTTVDVKKTKWKLRSLNGAEVEFSDLSGRVIFLNLWATWCGPCVAEMPSLQALYDSLKNEPVAFLTVSEESLDSLQRFMKRNALNLPVFQSVSMKPEKFELPGYPTTVILDKTGTAVLAEEGGRRWNDKNVIKFIRRFY